MKQLKGVHHVTAMTSSAYEIYYFFTAILGLRLVKKTVNQDDINTYHLFFADDKGSAGTDMTFFDFKDNPKAVHGVNEISRTSFRVPNDKALDYWIKRFDNYKVEHSELLTFFGRKVIYFNDFDGQLYALFSDQEDNGVKAGMPWQNGPVPNEYGITGLGPIFLTVDRIKSIETILTSIFKMNKTAAKGDYHLFEMGEGGNGASVIVYQNTKLPLARSGFGGIHHVAFRVSDKSELDKWENYLNEVGAPNSGYVDRFYFKSLYTRLYPGILFELATDGPGFIDDEENYQTLGEKLALPPKFRDKRQLVESIIKPLDTKATNKVRSKEYYDE